MSLKRTADPYANRRQSEKRSGLRRRRGRTRVSRCGSDTAALSVANRQFAVGILTLKIETREALIFLGPADVSNVTNLGTSLPKKPLDDPPQYPDKPHAKPAAMNPEIISAGNGRSNLVSSPYKIMDTPATAPVATASLDIPLLMSTTYALVSTPRANRSPSLEF